MRWKNRRGCAVAWRIALRLGSLGAVCRTGVGGSWKPLLCGFQIAVLRWTVYLGVLSGWTATACWPPSMPAGGWLSERQVELVKSATGLGAGGALILAHGLLDLRPGQIPELIAQLIENLEHGQHLLGRPVERQHRCPTLYFLLALRAVLARAAAFCPACHYQPEPSTICKFFLPPGGLILESKGGCLQLARSPIGRAKYSARADRSP